MISLQQPKIKFISRINNEPKLTEYKANALTKKIDTPTLKIISDRWVYLYTMRGSRTLYPLRMICAVKKSDSEHITFLTNIDEIRPKENYSNL